ncbi:MAG: GNAT family N-acetyltransferase [Phycisphaera sp.]|nr:GNAT family N-acetyltransferase [Phycisphaera sp.]
MSETPASSHPAPPTSFESPRLIIRRPNPHDAEAVNAAVRESIDALRRTMVWAQREPGVEETYAHLQEAVERWDARVDFTLHVFDKATGDFVGSSGLHRIDWSVPRFEIGYWVRTSHAGRGYATEATRAIADVAFEQLAARRVEILCSATNAASRRVAEKAGFDLEATLRQHMTEPDGSLRDTCIYARLR